VVIDNSQLVVISAAAKACTFRVVTFRERKIIGSVSYRDRYRANRIELYHLCCIGENLILRASLQVQQLLTGRVEGAGGGRL